MKLAHIFLLVVPGLAAVGAPALGQAGLSGYLPAERLQALADQAAPPPAAGSPEALADAMERDRAAAFRGGARWTLAQYDSDLDPALAGRFFDCALGGRSGPRQPAALTRLFVRLQADMAGAYEPARSRFARPRPSLGDAAPVCVPRDPRLMASYAYPSGHAAVGWIWSLAMAEAAPEAAQPILRRGREIGEGRVVCGVQHASDVLAGRALAEAVFAEVRGTEAFRQDLEAARSALAPLRAGVVRAPVCAAEALALKEADEGLAGGTAHP